MGNKTSGSHFHANVREVAKVLVDQFGAPTLGNKRNPFNELLYIILSSKTPPKRYQAVYRALRSVYRKAESLAHARSEDIAELISSGGLQNRKARAITIIAQRLVYKFGRVTLAPLATMADREAEAFLMSLPEVSKKTARCILMYSLDRHVFPVDSHCFRIARRLGWTCENKYLTDRLADKLQKGVPEHLRKNLHIGMVLLGRHYCFPKKQRCYLCPLLELCPTDKAKS